MPLNLGGQGGLTREQLLRLIQQAQQEGKLAPPDLADRGAGIRELTQKQERGGLLDQLRGFAGGPIAGSILGGLGGFAVGGPIGAIAGAGFGGAAGESVKRSVKGKEQSLKESLIQGGLGAGGEAAGLGIAKALQPVFRGIRGFGKEGVKAVGKATGLNPKELMSRAFPIKPATLARANRRGIDVFGELGDELAKGTIKPADTPELANQIKGLLKSKGSQVKSLITKATNKGARISTRPLINMLEKEKARLATAKFAGADRVIGQIDDHIGRLKSVKTFTPLEAQQQKMVLDDFINFSTKDPSVSQEQLETIRRFFKEGVEKSVGGDKIKVLNKRMGALIDAGNTLRDLGAGEVNAGLRELFGLPSAAAVGQFVGGPVGAIGLGGASIVQTAARTSPKAALHFANLFRGLPQTGVGKAAGVAGRGLGAIGQGIGFTAPVTGRAAAQAGIRFPFGTRGEDIGLEPIEQEGLGPIGQEGQELPGISQGQFETSPDGQFKTDTATGQSFSMDDQWIFDKASNDWVPNPNAPTAGGAVDSGDEVINQLNEALLQALRQGDRKSADFIIKVLGVQLDLRELRGPEEEDVLELSDVAIKNVADLQGAASDVMGLKRALKEKTSQFGPIAGLQVLNPFSPSRRLQAQIDRVRQVVGKALEGGVLRKEDEEKYKKILPIITDTPATAAFKLDQLERKLKQDLDRYISLQKAHGKGRAQLPDISQIQFAGQ